MGNKSNKWKTIFGEEFEYILRLGQSMHDPEQKKSFWDLVRSKKLADPSYSIYSDFPKAEEALSDKGKIARMYCGPVLEMLKKHVQPE